MTTTIVHEGSFDREAKGIPCPNVDEDNLPSVNQVEETADEDREFGCGRPGCCGRAFVCRICGARIVGRADAPGMGFVISPNSMRGFQ